MSVFSSKLRLRTNSRDGPSDRDNSKGNRGKDALNIELEPPEVQKRVKEFAKEFLDEYPHGPPSCPYKGKSKSCRKVMKGLPGLLHDDSLGGDVISETGGGGTGGPVEASPDKESEKMPGLREKMNLDRGRGHEAKPPKEMGFVRQEADEYLDQEPEFPIVDVDPEDISTIEMVDEIAPGDADYEEALEDESEEEDIMDVDENDVEAYDDEEPEAAMEVSEDEVEFLDDDMDDADDMDKEDDDEEDDDEDEDRARESCDKQGPPSATRGRQYSTRDHEAADAEEEASEMSDDDIVEVSEEDVEPVSECPSGCIPSPTPDEQSEEEVVDEAVFEEKEKEAEAEEVEDELATAAMEAPEKEENNMIYETISLDKVVAGADVNDVTLFLHGEDSENPHYVVLVDGDPVAKISMADQQLPPEHLSMFLDENYPEFVLEGIENFGLKETLNSVHARYYAASALEGEVASKMREAAVNELEDTRKVAMSDLKDKLISTAAVVIEGSMKNYLTDNPLKDALILQMGRVSIDENTAVDLIEEAWREAAVDYVTAMLDKAEEWIGAPQEVMDHHIKEITGMSYRHPGYRQADDEIPQYDDAISEAPVREKVAAVSVPANVPLRTAAPSSTSGSGFTGDKDYWKRQMNLTGRHMQQSLASYKRSK